MTVQHDLAALWEAHCRYEFETRDVDATMATMVTTPYVNHIPTMTGGVGHDELKRFYKYHFIGGNPPDTDDVRALVEEVAAGNAAIDLGNDRIEARMSEQHRHEAACRFRRRKVGRKVVGRADRSEGLEADGAAGLCIGRRSRTKNDAHGTSSCR